MPYTYSGSETIGTVANTGSILAISAASPALFPLGYRVMETYARYRFTRLALIYEPAVSTTTDGSMWLAFSPTPLTEPVTLTDVSTAASSASSAVWAPCRLDVRYEPTQKWLLNYATGTWNYKGPDYNLGNLYAIVVGAAPAGILGTLRIEYTVALVDRANKLPNLAGPPAPLALQGHLALRDQAEDSVLRGLLDRLDQLERKETEGRRASQDPKGSLDQLDQPDLQDLLAPLAPQAQPARLEPQGPPAPQESPDQSVPLDPPALVRSKQ